MYQKQKKGILLVIEDIPSNLFNLYKNYSHIFDHNFICQIMEQLVSSVQFIHQKGYLLLDLKPISLSFRCKLNEECLYFKSLSLCTQYLDKSTGQHREQQQTNIFVGSPGYASIRMHKGKSPCRQDDLECGFYLLWYMHYGELPWSQIYRQKKNINTRLKEILQLKMKIEEFQQFKQMPRIYQEYYNYVKALKYKEEPNYQYLRNLFHINRIQIKHTNQVDKTLRNKKGNHLKKPQIT